MKIAVIGAGNVGSRLAKLFILAGHEITIGSREQEKAIAIAAQLGETVKGAKYADAVASADVIIVTTPWANNTTLDVVQELGDLTGKIVIDCTNPLAPDYMSNTLGYTTSSAEEIAKLIPGVPVVKAFNTIFAEVMEPGKQIFDGQKATGFYCGDDAAAKAIAAKLIEDAGFEPVDAGVLQNARYLEPMAQLNIQIAYGLGGGTNVAFRYMRR
ncbi:NADPH-dependent F420 reductase [Cuspidothrix issatschenkoi]|uniref:F420-dependent NADP oxidoreductase n=1 Tax=Cuspidothrix issatschenkoi CHARLIE-1 TaxID=2052836 RepID=A0A2S6CNW1_9CYAN|nr:NADPH-dependent F420 reductase [Cuspidothrix issatschenkoi]PPJ61433.1 F420-dependent NADP oxidoreductase [Cuspidothrix issatschenkoi CHARLIE-1]